MPLALTPLTGVDRPPTNGTLLNYFSFHHGLLLPCKNWYCSGTFEAGFLSNGSAMVVYKIFKGWSDLGSSLSLVPTERPGLRGHWFKAFHGPSRRLSRNTSLSVRAMKCFNSPPNCLPSIRSMARWVQRSYPCLTLPCWRMVFTWMLAEKSSMPFTYRLMPV